MKRPVGAESASVLIDEKIKELGDWRGKMLAKVRTTIHEADPEIVEEWKWMGSPVWSRDGMIAVGNANERALKNLVRSAIEYNQIKLKSKAPVGTRGKARERKK